MKSVEIEKQAKDIKSCLSSGVTLQIFSLIKAHKRHVAMVYKRYTIKRKKRYFKIAKI